MFRQAVRRALALLLALCLLPAAALGEAASLAEEWPVDSSAVTRADFDLRVQLHADAFPADGLTDYRGWETFLSKLRLSGVIDLQRFPRPNNRMYMEAQLLLNDRELTRFSFEDYWGFRYVRSPALCNRSIHFQMNNYLEFMLKPYEYYELPTQYIALLTYPEVTAYLAECYEDVLTPYLHGEGNRTVSYDDLYQMCQKLDTVMTDAKAEQSYFFLLALLIDLGMADQVYDGLSYLEDYLDWLDPEQEGMTITAQGDTDRYEVGGHVLFTRTRGENGLSFQLSLPTENDEELALEYRTVKTVTDPMGRQEDIYWQLRQHMDEHQTAERASRLCLSGAHKDDIEVLINGRAAKQFGSQGQVRTAALSLKLAEREIHKNAMGEYPVMLLDDVLSELDPRRQEYVLNRISGGQVFITCCENDRLDTLLSGRVFHVRGGEVL